MPGDAPVALLLDVNAYINQKAGRLAAPVRGAINQALHFHCSVALAELAMDVANTDPKRLEWTALRDHHNALFATLLASRLLTPDAQVQADAGVITGTRGFQAHRRKQSLNDALIFLSAAKAGIPVLTANRDDFDLIQQLAPEGQFIHY